MQPWVVETISSEQSMLGFPGGLDGKESACNAGDRGSIPGLGRSPGGGHGNPFQYSGLENSMGRGAWQAAVYRITKSQTGLSTRSRVKWAVGHHTLMILPCDCGQSLPALCSDILICKSG